MDAGYIDSSKIKFTFLNIKIWNKYAIYAYTHGPVTGSGFLSVV